MQLIKTKIKNFRCYRTETDINFNNLTALIGKNDIGKSTILEALDIFFENRTLDKNDVNIDAVSNGEYVNITVVFDNLLDEIDLDAGAKTNLKDEYLLNCAKQMTVELLKEIDAFDEINEWFEQIKARLN